MEGGQCIKEHGAWKNRYFVQFDESAEEKRWNNNHGGLLYVGSLYWFEM
jgi:hypothetical protein